MKTIEINNLTKKFGSFIAVNDISFDVDKAEIFGFLGPNGAGKTTTIRMLCGILTPTSGNGTVAGFDILRENEKIKSRIGYMSQKFSLYNDLTVEENMDFFAGIYKITNTKKQERKEWAFTIAGLSDDRKRMTRELPTGYKQRLALVCALLHRPTIVFLDEPTAGVDPLSRRQFWDLIYELKTAEHTTIFVTTHYMDEAEHCERIGLIQDGRLTTIGTPTELKASIKSKIFSITAEPFLKVKEFLQAERLIKRTIPFGLSWHVFLDSDNAAQEIKNKLLLNNLHIQKFEPVIPSLEDVFVSVMEK
jgi:ABC-2 type transport system ATP-binding protein